MGVDATFYNNNLKVGNEYLGVNNLSIALGLTLVHYNAKHLRSYKINTNQFTSFVSGMSIAYILLHLLPEVINFQNEVANMFQLTLTNSMYLILATILLGSGIFFILERGLQKAQLNRNLKETYGHKSTFWIHIGAYFMYNLIIGILLADQRFETNILALVYLIAIGIHLLTNNWVIRQDFKAQYDLYGRKIICGAVLLGWLLGTVFPIHLAVTGLLEAFVAGTIILNAVEDELPYSKGKGFTPFLTGGLLYSLLLLVII